MSLRSILMAKTATGTWVSIGTILLPRFGSVTLTASPRTGWQFIEWQGCNSVTGANCTSSVSPLDADYTTTPKAVFREIVPVQIGAKPDAFTSQTKPTFGFSSTVAGATFTCQIGAAAVPCSGSSVVLPNALTDGPHTFKVTAIHNTNQSITPASYIFDRCDVRVQPRRRPLRGLRSQLWL